MTKSIKDLFDELCNEEHPDAEVLLLSIVVRDEAGTPVVYQLDDNGQLTGHYL